MVKVISNKNQADNSEETNEIIKKNSEIYFNQVTRIAGIQSELIELAPNQVAIIYKDVFEKLNALLSYRLNKQKSTYPVSGRFNFDSNRVLFSKMKLSELSINMLKTQKKRYISFILTTGITRTSANAKATRRDNIATTVAGIGLLVFNGWGFYASKNLYFCENHFLILDVETNRLLFYNQTQYENGNPAKDEDLRYNIYNGFTGYWLTKDPSVGEYSKKL